MFIMVVKPIIKESKVVEMIKWVLLLEALTIRIIIKPTSFFLNDFTKVIARAIMEPKDELN